MPRGLSSSITTELQNQNIKPIVLVEILFPTPQRITNHYKDITFNSNTYTASGHLLSITTKAENSEVDTSQFQVELSGVDNAFISIVLNNVVSNDNVNIDIASEFRYRNLKFNSKNLYVFVSQSGETADTAAALEICKKNKVKTCSIVNVIESTIARNSDWVLPIHAGPEIGVASTKAFTTQLVALMLLIIVLGKNFEISEENENFRINTETDNQLNFAIELLTG